jgi:hypothetical protein
MLRVQGAFVLPVAGEFRAETKTSTGDQWVALQRIPKRRDAKVRYVCYPAASRCGQAEGRLCVLSTPCGLLCAPSWAD